MAGVGDVLSTVLSGGLTYGRNEKMTAQATTAEKASKERVVKSDLRPPMAVGLCLISWANAVFPITQGVPIPSLVLCRPFWCLI